MPVLLERTVVVDRLAKNGVGFMELASLYRAPPHLMPTLRRAKEMGLELKITVDARCNIHAAEILLSPPAIFAD